jgi:hypothetical protein
MEDPLHRRGRTLEERFFQQKDEDLLEKLRKHQFDQITKEDIARHTGLKDEKLLDRLVKMNINVQTLTALSIVPLVEVAWADGEMDERERAALLKAAEEAGIPKDGPGYALLQQWLANRPDMQLLAAWKEYIAAMAQTLDAQGLTQIRANLINRARDVATAAGGFLGMSKISAAEQKKLDELERVFKS